MSDRKKLNHRRLAEGEATGHFHEISSGTLFSMPDGSVELDTSGGTVTHQEHGPVVIPAGEYDRLLVREVDEDEEARDVID
jgi:hypothetical protein